MKCPKCAGRSLSNSEVRGIQVEQCDHCGGIWCDPTELSRLLSIETRELKKLASGRQEPLISARAGKCPRDGTPMIRVASAKKRTVILETCPNCRGVWLDGGELKELIAG